MARWLIPLIVGLLLMGNNLLIDDPPTAADCPPADDDALPVAVLIEYDPWRMVIGSDSPILVIYDDGTLIFWSWDAESYLTVTLDEADTEALVDSLPLTDAYFALDTYYDTVMVTDMPTNTIHTWQDGERDVVHVYGDLRLPDTDEWSARPHAPAEFLALYDRLLEIIAAYEQADDAEVWLPPYIEMLVWPYDTSTTRTWPADWPGLDHPCTVNRHDDLYSIYVDSTNYDQLLEIVGGSVRLDGRTWTTSLRFPFPSEHLWMRPAGE